MGNKQAKKPTSYTHSIHTFDFVYDEEKKSYDCPEWSLSLKFNKIDGRSLGTYNEKDEVALPNGCKYTKTLNMLHPNISLRFETNDDFTIDKMIKNIENPLYVLSVIPRSFKFEFMYNVEKKTYECPQQHLSLKLAVDGRNIGCYGSEGSGTIIKSGRNYRRRIDISHPKIDFVYETDDKTFTLEQVLEHVNCNLYTISRIA